MLQVKWLKVKVLVAHPWTLCTVACQALLSMEFSGQEYWSGLPFPSPGESSQPRDQTQVSALQADSLLYKPPGMQVSLIESVEGLNRKNYLTSLPEKEFCQQMAFQLKLQFFPGFPPQSHGFMSHFNLFLLRSIFSFPPLPSPPPFSPVSVENPNIQTYTKKSCIKSCSSIRKKNN